MTQDNNNQISRPENIKTNEKPSIKKRVLGWLGYLAVFAAILFFMAPESWWQFGVAPIEGRKAAVNFTLESLDGAKWNFADQRGRSRAGKLLGDMVPAVPRRDARFGKFRQ